MRIKSEKQNINYGDTQAFFNRRAQKYKAENPYSVTMYQDDNPNLVIARNEKEVHKLLPLLEMNEDSKILDVACGIGRWSDAITTEIKEYCGIDFCQGLIELARVRNFEKTNRNFFVAKSVEVEKCLKNNGSRKYNRILLMGCLIYLNDTDVQSTLEQIERVTDPHTIVCIREPIGIKERLTLKREFSHELKDEYNAIYRTRDEIFQMLQQVFIENGYHISDEGFLFEEEDLNNRNETSQYYFILKR